MGDTERTLPPNTPERQAKELRLGRGPAPVHGTVHFRSRHEAQNTRETHDCPTEGLPPPTSFPKEKQRVWGMGTRRHVGRRKHLFCRLAGCGSAHPENGAVTS